MTAPTADERARLREVLAGHGGRELGDYPGPFVVKCWCGEDGTTHRYPGDAWDAHRAHVATAVLAWLRERLASEAVREAAAEEITDAHWCESNYTRGCNCKTWRIEQADAALTAVVGALGVES